MRRLFWIGAAALLGVAALISIVALVRGDFTETDWKLLGTLGSTLAAGSACLAGLALIDRRSSAPLGPLAVVIGVAGYAVIVWELWSDVPHDELLTTALLLIGAALLTTTCRLLLQRQSLQPLYAAHLLLAGFATAATLGLIWDTGSTSDSWAKLVGAAWILAVLTWFLVPVLGRTSRSSGERVVGHGPGRFEVELADGETLVVRR